MWYKLLEQWNSGIATPSPRPVPRLSLSVPWLNSLASMDMQHYVTWSTALCESLSVEIISAGTPDEVATGKAMAVIVKHLTKNQ